MKRMCAVLMLLLCLAGSAFADDDSDLKKERAIGRRVVEQIEREWELSSDPAALSKLEMIASRLSPYMERKIPWEIRIVNTEIMNAFCLPGGFIFFTTGILDELKTDSELAAVMAHEMIHADRRHGMKIAAESQKVTFGALAAIILTGGAAAPIVLAQVAQVAITSSYTMKLETEADTLGLDAMIKAGYSPTGMITLFEHFISEEYRQPIHEYGIYMNHPDTPKRLSAAVKTLHDRKIPIERKYPLGLLRTSISEGSESITLSVDGVSVLKGRKNDDTRKAVKKIRDALDKYLQLELAPYDLHTENGALYIGNNFIAGNIDGMTTPKDIRTNLMRAINSARAKYPTSKFFK